MQGNKSLSDQITSFALYLIESEAEVCPRKNKRSKTQYENFLLSVEWLCKKLLAAHASFKNASVRISRDKNRYKAGRYVSKGLSYDITITGALGLMHKFGYVEMTNRGHYSRDTGQGDQTRYRLTDALLRHFEVVSSTLPKQLVGCEHTDPIVVQVATERRMKWKNGKPKFITVKVRKEYTDNQQTRE